MTAIPAATIQTIFDQHLKMSNAHAPIRAQQPFNNPALISGPLKNGWGWAQTAAFIGVVSLMRAWTGATPDAQKLGDLGSVMTQVNTLEAASAQPNGGTSAVMTGNLMTYLAQCS